MKNLDKAKYIAMGMTISATVMATVVPVVAKSGQETLTAIYKNIKVVNEGILVDTGSAEAFIANGTTYLPVRAVGEAVGKKVSWNGNTNTVYLGQVPGEKKYLTDVCPPYDGKSYKVYKSTENKFFKMSGEKRTNGFTINWDEGFVIINANGEYRQATFDVGHLDGKKMIDGTLNIYLDGKLTEEIELKADDVSKKISVPLNNALQVKLEVVSHASVPYYGFADVEVN